MGLVELVTAIMDSRGTAKVPREERDLSETLPSVSAALDRRALAFDARRGAPPAPVETLVSRETAESLRALGYAR